MGDGSMDTPYENLYEKQGIFIFQPFIMGSSYRLKNGRQTAKSTVDLRPMALTRANSSGK